MLINSLILPLISCKVSGRSWVVYSMRCSSLGLVLIQLERAPVVNASPRDGALLNRSSRLRTQVRLVRDVLSDLLLQDPLAELPKVRRQRLILCLVRFGTERVIGLSEIGTLILFRIFGNLSSGGGPECGLGALIGRHERHSAEVVEGVPESSIRLRETSLLTGRDG